MRSVNFEVLGMQIPPHTEAEIGVGDEAEAFFEETVSRIFHAFLEEHGFRTLAVVATLNPAPIEIASPENG